jgi:hypothetical protein
MSDSSIVSRIANRSSLEARLGESEDELCDNLGCFGWLRGVRERSLMLELRRKSGFILAIGYAWIERVEFDPAEGITVYAAGQRIRIRGTNLNGSPDRRQRLFEGLARHCVPWIQEVTEAQLFEWPAAACLVESIQW